MNNPDARALLAQATPMYWVANEPDLPDWGLIVGWAKSPRVLNGMEPIVAFHDEAGQFMAPMIYPIRDLDPGRILIERPKLDADELPAIPHPAMSPEAAARAEQFRADILDREARRQAVIDGLPRGPEPVDLD